MNQTSHCLEGNKVSFSSTCLFFNVDFEDDNRFEFGKIWLSELIEIIRMKFWKRYWISRFPELSFIRKMTHYFILLLKLGCDLLAGWTIDTYFCWLTNCKFMMSDVNSCMLKIMKKLEVYNVFNQFSTKVWIKNKKK